jgi:hypothetical protein
VQIKEENGKLAIVGPVAWFAVNEAVVKRLDVPANHPFPIYLKRRGEPKAKLHVLPPQKHPYWLMIGDQVGNSPFLMVQNGADAAKPPVEAHRISVQVGPDKPVPPPPPPPNELADKLRPAYAADTDPQKNTHRENLAAFYRQAALGVAEFKTWGECYAKMQDASRRLGTAGKLSAVQGMVASLLQQELPYSDADTIDDAGRAKAVAVFNRIAAALEALK